MSIKTKFLSSAGYSVLWLLFSLIFAIPWISEISAFVPPLLAWIAISGSALVPGLAMAFVNASLLFDRRPRRKRLCIYPDLTIIVAAYNEEKTIFDTLSSIDSSYYSGNIKVIVANDGSSDGTSDEIARFVDSHELEVHIIEMVENYGKAEALNHALYRADTEYVVTLDADSSLHSESLARISESIVAAGPSCSAVAGAILCGNPGESYISEMQYWDYLLGISAVKRAQSMYGGTLVAQGSFSIYRRDALFDLGGWPDKIGEDIVLSWAMLARGYSIGHSEKAICWTTVPSEYKQFYRQRKRWSRGLIEAFRMYPSLLFNRKLYSAFVWYNLMFPYIDVSFMLVFVPGAIAALFGFYLLAGKITLLLIPLAFVYGLIILGQQRRDLRPLGIEPNRRLLEYMGYMFLYQLIMTPATISGYAAELFKRKRVWK